MTALAARCELWGGARQHSRFNNCGEGGSTSCSLSRFFGCRARGLYPLAGGGGESGAAHLDLRGPPDRCSGCWRHRGRRLDKSLKWNSGGADGAGAARGTGSSPTSRSRQLAERGSTSCSLSRFFGCRARGLYPLARGRRIRPAPGMAPALMVCWIEGGAGNFLFSVLPGGAVELPGRSRPAPGVVDLRRGGPR